MRAWKVMGALFVLGCGGGGGALDAGPPDGAPGDAAATDSGPTDAAPADAGASDAGPADAGPTDGGPVDAARFDPVAAGYPQPQLVFGEYSRCEPTPGDAVTERSVPGTVTHVLRFTDADDIVHLNLPSIGWDRCVTREAVQIWRDGALLQEIPMPSLGTGPTAVTAVAAPEVAAVCDTDERGVPFELRILGREDGGTYTETVSWSPEAPPYVACNQDFPMVGVDGSIDIFTDTAVSHMTIDTKLWTGRPSASPSLDPPLALDPDATILLAQRHFDPTMTPLTTHPFTVDGASQWLSTAGMILDLVVHADPSPLGETECASRMAHEPIPGLVRLTGTWDGQPFRAELLFTTCLGNFPRPGAP